MSFGLNRCIGHRADAAARRESIGDGRRRDTWNLCDARLQRFVELLLPLRCRITHRTQHEGSGNRAVLVESERSIFEIPQTAQQQRRTTEQHERDCNLRDHQRLSKKAARRTNLTRGRQAFPAPGIQRRSHSEQDAGTQRHSKREDQRSPIETRLSEAHDSGWRDRDENADQSERQTTSGSSANYCQDHAFGQRLPENARARRTDCRAHSHFPVAPGGPRQHEVRNIGARYQQQRRHRAQQQP